MATLVNWTGSVLFVATPPTYIELQGQGSSTTGLNLATDTLLKTAGGPVQLPSWDKTVTAGLPVSLPLTIDGSTTPSGFIALYYPSRAGGNVIQIVPAAGATSTRAPPMTLAVVNTTPFFLFVDVGFTGGTPAPVQTVVAPWTQTPTLVGTSLPGSAWPVSSSAVTLYLGTTASAPDTTAGASVPFFNPGAASSTAASPGVLYAAPDTFSPLPGSGINGTEITLLNGSTIGKQSIATQCTLDTPTAQWTMAVQYTGNYLQGSSTQYWTSTLLSMTNTTDQALTVAAAHTCQLPVDSPNINCTPGPGDVAQAVLQPTIDNKTGAQVQTIAPGATQQVLVNMENVNQVYPYLSIGSAAGGPIFLVPVTQPSAATQNSMWHRGVLSPTTTLYLVSFNVTQNFQGLPAACMPSTLQVILATEPVLYIQTPWPTQPIGFEPVLTYPALQPPSPGSLVSFPLASQTAPGMSLSPTTTANPHTSTIIVGYSGPLVFTVFANAPPSSLAAAVDYGFTYDDMNASTIVVDTAVLQTTALALAPGAATTWSAGSKAPQSPQVQVTTVSGNTILDIQVPPSVATATTLLNSPSYLDSVCMQPGFQDCRPIVTLDQGTCLGFFSNTVGSPCTTACGGREFAGPSQQPNTSIDGTCATLFNTYCSKADSSDPACACISRNTSTVPFSLDGSVEGAKTLTDTLAPISKLSSSAYATLNSQAACWWPPCSAGYTSALPDLASESQCTQSFTSCFAAVGRALADPTSAISVEIDNACGTQVYVPSAQTYSDLGSSQHSTKAAAPYSYSWNQQAEHSKKMLIILAVIVIVIIIVVIGAVVGVIKHKNTKTKAAASST
jgi:hypothetical protein